MQATMKFLQPCMKVAAFSTVSVHHQQSRNNCRLLLQILPRSSSSSSSLSASFSTFQPTCEYHLTSKPYLSLPSSTRSSSPIIATTTATTTALFTTQADADTDTDTDTTTNNDDGIVKENQQLNQDQQEFASSYHAPVMYQECIDALLKRSHNYVKKHKNKYKNKSKNGSDNANENENVNVNDDSVNNVDADNGRPRIFIDGTLGGGGHSLCLLQSLSPGDILIGCDVDPSALATASIRLKDYIIKSNHGNEDGNNNDNDSSSLPIEKPIFIPVNSNFKDLERHVKVLKHPITGKSLLFNNDDDDDDDTNSFIGVDGILLDLGVSSHQIDNAERGFAFMKDGPLDMRMFGGKFNNYDSESSSSSSSQDTNNDNEDESSTYQEYVNNLNMNQSNGGLTAADICNEFAEEDISRILKKYGDEPRARKIAQSIVSSRPLTTTGDLKDAVALVTPQFVKARRRMGLTATLARVFQSLRIVVNDEDGVLREAFEDMAPALIGKGGRLVVLAYHSMEDRASKRVIRDGKVDGRRLRAERDVYGNTIRTQDSSPWKALGRKQKATEEEIAVNSRARSAVLRVAEKI